MGQHRAAGAPGGRRVHRASGLVGLALLALAAMTLGSPALAQPAMAQPQVGELRLGHLSPSTPAVDIYLTAPGAEPSRQPLVTGADYGAVTPYQELAPGRYTIEMRATGTPADTPAPLSSAVDIGGGTAQSLLFFDTGAMGTVQGQLVTDDLSAAAPGSGRVRVVQGAAGGVPVDMQAAGGPRLATALAYGTITDYASVEARQWDVAIASGPEQLQATLDVADGSVSTVVLTRDPAGILAVTPLVDVAGSPAAPLSAAPSLEGPPVAGPQEETAAPQAAAPEADAPQVPQGGVPAGAGGAAGEADPAPVLLGIGGALLLVFAISGRPLRRSRHG